jgi:exodeoxyribonuclease III
MKIATYNAASIRARLPRLTEWLDENQPDLIGIQETKVENDKFPISEFESRGYHVALNGQKSWNGVAILSKEPLDDITIGFPDDALPNDARIIAGTYRGKRIINTYVPNGNKVGSEKWEYKLAWLEKFAEYIHSVPKGTPLIWMGDINVAPQAHDVFDSNKVAGGVGHHPDEFSRLTKILNYGLIDLFRLHHFESGHFTFWEFMIPGAVDKGVGWRIDHIYATEDLAETNINCWIDVAPRKLEKPSDHTFVLAEW